jgi:hypothetical protein
MVNKATRRERNREQNIVDTTARILREMKLEN